MILNIYRIPGSRAKGKGNPREGKGARRGGQQREEILAKGGDQPGEGYTYQHREGLEVGGAISIKISRVSENGCSLYGGKC